MTFGKVMGGGFPAAGFGGPAELMQHLAPVGGVYQAGTLSGNPVATAAGLATLRLATPEVYAHIDRAAEELQSAVAAALTAAGVPHVIQHAGNLFSVFFVSEDVTAVPDFAVAVATADRPVRRLLSCHARLRCLSAPQRLRGLVSLGGA